MEEQGAVVPAEAVVEAAEAASLLAELGPFPS